MIKSGWRITTGLLCMLLVVLLALSGCGEKSFNAGDYVQAMLDASYKGDFDAYTKQNIGKKSDAKAMYEDNLNALVKSFAQIFGDDMSDEASQSLSDAMADLCSHVQYEVTEAEADGSHFNVEVKIKPLQFTSVLQDSDFNKEAEEAVRTAIEKDADISSEDLMKVLTDLLITRFGDIAAHPTYGEETVVTVVVKRNDDDAYEITQESWDEIDQALIQ